jgi:hypothetical protein
MFNLNVPHIKVSRTMAIELLIWTVILSGAKDPLLLFNSIEKPKARDSSVATLPQNDKKA